MTAATLPDDAPLIVARDWLRERVDEGEHCPCCTQFAKVYRRRIHATMALALITLYRAHGTDWGHLPTALEDRKMWADSAKLRYWGLLEEETHVRRDDGGRAGYWRVTPLGKGFVRGLVQVPTYARLYDGRCLGLVGPDVSIRECLGKRFDYAELMAGL